MHYYSRWPPFCNISLKLILPAEVLSPLISTSSFPYPLPQVPGDHYYSLLLWVQLFQFLHLSEIRWHCLFMSGLFHLASWLQVHLCCCKWQDFPLLKGQIKMHCGRNARALLFFLKVWVNFIFKVLSVQ
jgi:hypothetical protein